MNTSGAVVAIGLLAGVAALADRPAMADQLPYIDAVGAWGSTHIMRYRGNDAQAAEGVAVPEDPVPAVAPDGPTAVFSRSTDLSRQIALHFAEDRGIIDPMQQIAIVNYLKPGGRFETQMRQLDFDPDSLSDVIALRGIALWEIVNEAELTEPERLAVRDRTRRDLVSDLKSEAKRQTIADRLALLTAMDLNRYGQLIRENDQAGLERLRTDIDARMSGMGLDLTELVPTTDGLVPRQGAR